MIYDDSYFIAKFNNKRISKHIISKECNEDEILYLKNRYNDSFSLQETIVRIIRHIDKHPTCKICGAYLRFFGNREKPFRTYCSVHCANSDPIVYNKQNETKLKRYNSKNNQEKIKQTCLIKYGSTNALGTNTIGRNKALKTKELRYGNKYYVNPKKIKDTFIKKYGIRNVLCSGLIRDTFDYSKAKIREFESKKKNNTINTSKLEDQTYLLLKEKYNDIIRQYISNLYPFYCDFYIPSLDLYIECQYGWTHGNHPYDNNDKEDQSIVDKWKNNNTEYYNNAIHTWIIRDVNKRNIAKHNNLNYIEFWNIDELKHWIQNN